jgi:hypothetical protein
MLGDHIRALRGGRWNHAIDCGDATVIHVAPEAPTGERVRRTYRPEFEAGADAVEVVTHRERVYSPRAVVARAFSPFRDPALSGMFLDSEAFAAWCKTGRLPEHPRNVAVAPVGIAPGAALPAAKPRRAPPAPPVEKRAAAPAAAARPRKRAAGAARAAKATARPGSGKAAKPATKPSKKTAGRSATRPATKAARPAPRPKPSRAGGPKPKARAGSRPAAIARKKAATTARGARGRQAASKRR